MIVTNYSATLCNNMIFKPKIRLVTYLSLLIAIIMFVLLAIAFSQAVILSLIAVSLLVTILTFLKTQIYASVNNDMLIIKHPLNKKISIDLNSINFIGYHRCISHWLTLKLPVALFNNGAYFIFFKSKDKPMKMEAILGWSKADIQILFSYLEKNYSHIKTELYFKEDHF